MAQWFRGNSQEFVADHFSRADGLAHDAANPFHLEWLTVLLKGLASACGNLPEAQLDELGIQESLASLIANEPVPKLADMWADRT